MKKLLICFAVILITITLSAWGFYAHKLINEHAIYSLPPPLSIFFKTHYKLIREKAINPDKRCYTDSLEPPRHYIDLDQYESPTADSIPRYWSKAREKYSEKQLRRHGMVPWQIQITYQQLVQAFIKKDAAQIINKAADLGHYVADAHVPLHTTMNYNGQFTGQVGIHALWESRLPEQFAKQYKLSVGPAVYIKNTQELAWTIVHESNLLVEEVLKIEKDLAKTFPSSLQKGYITRGNVTILTYADAYAQAYHERLTGMVEARLRLSLKRIASLWLSAWVDAGQPTLNIDYQEPPEKTLKKEKETKLLGREEWH